VHRMIEQSIVHLPELVKDIERPVSIYLVHLSSYKQLAYIGHLVGMSKTERSGWYRVAESVPLSQRHAGHILSHLQREAA
jgi:hypothetical protein